MRTGQVSTIVVALLALSAGCSGFLGEPDSQSTPKQATPTQTPKGASAATVDPTPESTDTPEPTPTATPEPTPTPTPEKYYDSPWTKRVVTVSIDQTDISENRDIRPAAKAAIEYWNRRMDKYTQWDFTFKLINDTYGDLRLEVTKEDIICGNPFDVGYTLGCAPLLDSYTDYSRTVKLSYYQTDTSLQVVTRHELGHALGLNHSEEPHAVMGNESVEKGVQNATSKIQPYALNDVTVTVVNSSFSNDTDIEKINSEARYATEYFQEGAHGTVPQITYEFEPNASAVESEFVVYGAKSDECRLEDDGSLAAHNGINRDSDPALEEYTQTEICLKGLDEEATSWHIAYWIGAGMGLDGDEYPTPLRSDDYDERRGDWH